MQRYVRQFLQKRLVVKSKEVREIIERVMQYRIEEPEVVFWQRE